MEPLARRFFLIRNNTLCVGTFTLINLVAVQPVTAPSQRPLQDLHNVLFVVCSGSISETWLLYQQVRGRGLDLRGTQLVIA